MDLLVHSPDKCCSQLRQSCQGSMKDSRDAAPWEAHWPNIPPACASPPCLRRRESPKRSHSTQERSLPGKACFAPPGGARERTILSTRILTMGCPPNKE